MTYALTALSPLDGRYRKDVAELEAYFSEAALFRYRARNWPDTLDATGRERWDDYRRQRLAEGSGLSEYGFEGFFAEIQALRATHAGDGARLVLLDQLEQWGHQLQSQL